MRLWTGLVVVVIVIAAVLLLPINCIGEVALLPPASRQGGNETFSLVRGRVVDADSGEPVAATLVNGTGVVPPVSTADDGSYAIYNLTEGKYLFEVRAEGYRTKDIQIIVFENSTVDFDIELEEDVEEPEDANVALWILVGTFLSLLMILLVIYIISSEKKKAKEEEDSGKDN